jgi:type IV pilus assembly protein PilP
MAAGKRLFAAFAVLLLVSGCAARDFGDLETFKDQLQQRPKPPVAPLPEFIPYQAFAYGAGNLRSPFEPPQRVQPVDPNRAQANVRPDRNRVKQYLEQFAIGQLKMVGTLSRDARLYGLIEDPSGGVHRVGPGDFMGNDHGRVHGINEGTIELVEIVSDGTGGWIERARTVSLGGGS